MALGGKPLKPSGGASASSQAVSSPQVDFELEFFVQVLHHMPDYVDVLRVVGNLLTLKGRFAEGLVVDKRLVQLRRHDPVSHYNLACSYALLNRRDQSIECLRKALEIGYRDFRYIREDHDLENLRLDPRFETLLLEYEPA